MIKSILTVAAAALALAACATPEERAAQARAEMDGMMAVYGPACERLGYRADEDRWRDCVLRMASRDDARARYPMSTTCFGHRGFYNCTTF